MPSQPSPAGAVSVSLDADGFAARWSGTGKGAVRIGGRGVDLQEAAAAGKALVVRYKVDHPPEATVRLGFACGVVCVGGVDVTDTLKAAEPGTWRSLAFGLSCLTGRGVGLAKVDGPLAIETAGAFGLEIAEARIDRDPAAILLSGQALRTVAAAAGYDPAVTSSDRPVGPSLRANSTRSRTRLMAAWSVTEATDRCQKSASTVSRRCASQITGRANETSRLPLLSSDGLVLPSAWNIAEQAKVSPVATKFHDWMPRYSTATAATAGSLVNGPTSTAGRHWHSRVSVIITREPPSAA